ncbi:Cerato-platanin [Lactarius psammicola]|nr:Cerato-platanin [Lactarius psammicola]
MKLVLSIIAPLVELFFATHVRYDTTYGHAGGSLSTVACSNGANGLLTRGFTTFGSLPTFPNIGAAQAVAGWNSPACGSCWEVSYRNQAINVIAIDHAGDGFNLSLEAMNNLTNGHAEEFGVIDAQAVQIDNKYCGL